MAYTKYWLLAALAVAILVPISVFAQIEPTFEIDLPEPTSEVYLPEPTSEVYPSAEEFVLDASANPAKFDAGFYEKIQHRIQNPTAKSSTGEVDGIRYYNVAIVVAGSQDGHDSTVRENMDALVIDLEAIGAKNVTRAASLSFVTAAIPLDAIPDFSSNNKVYALGDGELPLTPLDDIALQTIHGTSDDIRAVTGTIFDGSGVTVGIIDLGYINHNTAFGDPDGDNYRVVDQVFCDGNTYSRLKTIGCRDIPLPENLSLKTTHATQVAQILAASGLSSNNGVAPGVDLVVTQQFAFSLGLNSYLHALDYLVSNNVDVVNVSIGIGKCSAHSSITMDVIVNDAVDRGLIFVGAAGNSGSAYESVHQPACSRNVISVGGINDRDTVMTMYDKSSRGPATVPGYLERILLKPEIVAPAVSIQSLEYKDSTSIVSRSGTSLAAPQVAGAAAILLQAEPDMDPTAVKSALLLGASWTGPVPCTSSQYEQENPNDDCSHARQPAGAANSLSILNNVGFGILNVSKSIQYAEADINHIVAGAFDVQTSGKQYTFEVTDATKPVKIILSWLSHPNLSSYINSNGFQILPHVSDLDFVITDTAGNRIEASSTHQTNEFAVFVPQSTGTHTITVSGTGFDKINRPAQKYSLASTLPLAESDNLQPTVAQQFGDLTLDLNFASHTIQDTAAYFEDGEDLQFSVVVEPLGIITASVDSDSLVLSSIRDAYGTAIITVTATDSNGLGVSSDFKLVVGTSQLSLENYPFNSPTGIEVNHVGTYVTDTGNNQVVIFDLDGNYVDMIGRIDKSAGSEQAEFNSPTGIETDSTRLLVADTGNGRIQMFDFAGNYVGERGILQDTYLLRDIVIDTNSFWATTDSKNFLVEFTDILSPLTGTNRLAAYQPPTWISSVQGITMREPFLIADQGNHRITAKWDNFISHYIIPNLGQSESFDPFGLENTDTHLYVTDNRSHKIHVFRIGDSFEAFYKVFTQERSTSGVTLTYMHEFGSAGSDNGQFHMPSGIATDDTSLFVVDQGNNRIEVFDLALLLSPPSTSPTVEITSSVPNGEKTTDKTVSFTVTFSEPVTEFDSSGIAIGGGVNHSSPKITGFSGSGAVYTFDVHRGSTDGVISVSIHGNAAINSARNPSVASDEYRVEITSRPTVVIGSSVIKNGDTTYFQTIPFFVEFSEKVDGFTADDILISGTADGGSPKVSNFGFPTRLFDNRYTFDVIRGDSDGTIVVSIPPDIATSKSSGNPNAASDSYTVTIDPLGILVFKHRLYMDIPDAEPERPAKDTITITEDVIIGKLAVNTLVQQNLGGDIRVELVYPDGDTVLLKPETIANGYVISNPEVPPPGVAGGQSAGEWEIRISDHSIGHTTTRLLSWTISITPWTATDAIHAKSKITSIVENNTPTSLTTVPFTAVFSERVTGFTADDILISGTADGGSPKVTNFAGSGAVYTFDVMRGNSDGTIKISIPEISTESGYRTDASETYAVTIAPTGSLAFKNAPNIEIPDYYWKDSGISSVGDTMTISQDAVIGEASLDVHLYQRPHEYGLSKYNDVKIQLIPPDGNAILISPSTHTNSIPKTYTTQLAGLAGTDLAGDWTISISDNDANYNNPGSRLNSWGLSIEPNTPIDTAPSADNTIPVITAPDDIITEATGKLTILDIDNATATDDTDPNPEITSDAPASFPLGNTTITWTATDDSGNAANATQTVAIQDTTPPAFDHTPGDESILTAGGATSLEYSAPTATDIVDDTVDVSCTPQRGTQVFESTVITCTATDDSGNSDTISFNVIIIVDAEPPAIRNRIQNFEITEGDTARLYLHTKFSDQNAMTYAAKIADNSTVSAQIQDSKLAMTGLQPGTTQIEACADDGAHEPVCQTFRVDIAAYQPITIKNRIQNFEITEEETAMLYLHTKFAGSISEYTAEIADDTILSAQIQNTKLSMTGLQAGATQVEACANNDAGESVCQQYRVTITAPLADLIIVPPSNVTVEATGRLTVLDIGTATANNNAEITNDAPNSFPLDNTTVTWTATDSAGNTVTDTQIITVQDTTPPTVDVPDDITLRTDNVSYTVHYDFTATDAVDDDVFIRCNSPSGLGFHIGTHNVRCAAVDSSGNRATGSFKIIIERITPIPNDSALLWNNFERSVSLGDFDRTGDLIRAKVTDSGIETIQRYFFPAMDDNGSRVVYFRECEDTCTMTLVSPLASPQDSVMLEFDKFQSDNRSTGMLRLDISPDREDWETLQLYQGAEFKTGTWTHEQFVLDSGTYFRFVSDTSGLFYPQFIDNILVTEIP